MPFRWTASGEGVGYRAGRRAENDDEQYGQDEQDQRNRHDGVDIVHLILKQREAIDWQRLIMYMSPHWEVLLCHLLMFRWIYPSERDAIPDWLLDDLLERLSRQREGPPSATKLCRGRLLSSSDYRSATEKWGFLNVEDECGNERR